MHCQQHGPVPAQSWATARVSTVYRVAVEEAAQRICNSDKGPSAERDRSLANSWLGRNRTMRWSFVNSVSRPGSGRQRQGRR